ncbi:hypothetical protein AV645_07095 [Acinetobacter calcoaceticus]|uniref:Signal peptide protein n=1 Tax=Acinetobacter oleivorans TaxID=1148157 RepID=A0A0B2UCF3_9GAMM|nr:hypothetical protein [Acinetobacter calcoaceticus]KHN68706.1 signal peptide protein [Acinetobacter oleivorans]KUM11435.1 hypothetical protein AV645_07095 [Acinetobacter calcoaceticus]
MPEITYSGSQAAFSFDGIQVGKDQTVEVSASDLTRISKGKAFKSLVEKGELVVSGETKSSSGRGGKGGKQNDATGDAAKAAEEAALAAVRAELAALEVTFSEDETLEQLQAKLAQAKE